MRYLFIALYEKSPLWLSIIAIPCAIYGSFLGKYPCLSFIIKVILAISLAIIAIGGMMSYLFPYIKTPKTPLKEKGIIRTLYLNSDKIITQIYCWFFALYMIFSLEYRSISYNYLMLLLIGLFWGYKITMRAKGYIKEETSSKKQKHKNKKKTVSP